MHPHEAQSRAPKSCPAAANADSHEAWTCCTHARPEAACYHWPLKHTPPAQAAATLGHPTHTPQQVCTQKSMRTPTAPATATPTQRPTCAHAHQVHHRAAPQHDREGQQHPGQVGRGEVEEPQEAHLHVLVPPPPHIHLQGGAGVGGLKEVSRRGAGHRGPPRPLLELPGQRNDSPAALRGLPHASCLVFTSLPCVMCPPTHPPPHPHTRPTPGPPAPPS